MAIYRFLEGGSFDPDDIARMTTAYESALNTLRLNNRFDAVTEVIAKKIIEITRRGETEPQQIYAQAVRELGIPKIDE